MNQHMGAVYQLSTVGSGWHPTVHKSWWEIQRQEFVLQIYVYQLQRHQTKNDNIRFINIHKAISNILKIILIKHPS